jgi:plasmid stabilization system protein ParE
MAYRVQLTRRAKQDLTYIYEQISAEDSVTAAQRFNGLEAAIDSLERFPRRCPVAPETERFKRLWRHLLYGSKRNAYRVIYDIDEPRKLVRVRTIRHAAMDALITEGRKS